MSDEAVSVQQSRAKFQLTLVYGVAGQYQVKSITNTIQYKPGEWLNPPVVDELCKHPDWNVVMVDNDIVKEILGAAISKLPLPV